MASSGGGIANDSGGGALTITRSTIDANHAAYAGGIYSIHSQPLVISQSTISGNTATSSGGGLVLDAQHATIANATAGNSAVSVATMSASGGHATLTNSTVANNAATTAGGFYSGGDSSADLRNTIFAGNAGGDFDDVVVTTVASVIGVPGGLTLADILDPAGLVDNGGPTKTIALANVAKNPAKGKGDAATCAAAPIGGLDQRGLPRTPPCDIGAFEIQP